MKSGGFPGLQNQWPALQRAVGSTPIRLRLHQPLARTAFSYTHCTTPRNASLEFHVRNCGRPNIALRIKPPLERRI